MLACANKIMSYDQYFKFAIQYSSPTYRNHKKYKKSIFIYDIETDVFQKHSDLFLKGCITLFNKTEKGASCFCFRQRFIPFSDALNEKNVTISNHYQ